MTHTPRHPHTRHNVGVFDPRVAGTYGLFAMIAVLVVAYVYLVNASVMSAVERKQSEDHAARIAARVATLEAEYFSLSESVTLDEALAKGFVVPSAEKTLFASRIVAEDTRITMH